MEEKPDEEFLPGYSTVRDFSADGCKRVVQAVKAFQALPQPGPSWDLNKSYPEFSKAMKHARSKIVPMMTSLLKHVNMPVSDFRSRDVDEKFEFLVECNDDMLERIGSSLDAAEGLFKKSEMVVVDKGLVHTALKTPGNWGKRKNTTTDDNEESKQKNQNISHRQIKKPVFRLKVHEKPQLKFAVPADNSLSPFVPKLKEKPHSLKPLSILPEYTLKNEEFFGHPYAVELNKWVPSNEALKKSEPQIPKLVKETSISFINNLKELNKFMCDISNKKVIAVDLEHHSYRTFLGLTCLIQISTKEKDYVIDSLSLREELGVLNDVFTDPKVIKVFHGAGNDIEWLQRDFGLYVVNMFDTHIAAKTLGLPQNSLQYLLGKYCDISQNKSFQLADWRLRPLPNEMIEYARQDTHFLIYIFECMRNELIDAGNEHNNLLTSVYEQSTLVCLKRYEKPGNNPQLALRKTRRQLNNRQLYAYTEIYKWRDEKAREKDESLGYVLPNHMLLTIAETLPKEMNGILACCDPVPPLIHANLGRIHKIVTTARELPLRQETTQKNKVEKKQKLKNWVVFVNSIHDVAPIETYESTTGTGGEDEEDFSLKTQPQDSDVIFPQQWNQPEQWTDLVGTKAPSMKFNRNVSYTRQPYQPLQISNIRDIAASESAKSPYGRYEISKRIVEMLRDPKKQAEIDMNDPLVKVVSEAVLADDSDDINENPGDLPVQELAKVLDEGEFIPFNPLAQMVTQKKRKKDQKVESHEGQNFEDRSGNHQGILGLEEVRGCKADDQDQEEGECPSSPPILNSKQKKSKKRRAGKIIHRLKNAFAGNKKGSQPANDADSDIEVIEEVINEDHNSRTNSNVEDSHSSAPPAKRMKHVHQDARQGRGKWSRNSKFNRQDKNPQGGNHQKNKSGIFKAWQRKDNSVMFK